MLYEVITDFQAVSDRIPFLADLKPSGKYVMEDLHNVGGTPAVMKYLLEEGLIRITSYNVCYTKLLRPIVPEFG